VKKYWPNEPNKVTDILGNVEKALKEEYHKLLTVCRPINGKAEIDVAILRALLKKEEAKREKNESTTLAEADKYRYLQTQLSLALKWDRIDIAQNFIFTDENRDKVNKEKRSLSKIVFLFVSKTNNMSTCL
jgi:hypothetical protein